MFYGSNRAETVMKRLLLATACLAFATPAHANENEEALLKSHVAFLASDAMRGRESGSPEYDIAAEYVASQFMALGLKPAGGNDRYLQPVPLVSTKLLDQGKVSLRGAKGDAILSFGDEFVASASLKVAALKMDAPLVFVGFGVVAPDYKRNDYAGVDVRGKIVVMLSGAPKSIPGEIRAHYGNGATKAVLAEAKGAIGIITVETPTRAKVRKFEDVARDWESKRMTWRLPDGSGFAPGGGAPGLAYISLKGAEKLFAGVPGGASQIMAAAETPAAKMKPTPLGMNALIETNSQIIPMESSNVAGVILGSDPKLAPETIVLSGHLDHIGVGVPIKGDAIYNGAMDNAVGIASMIEVARRIMASPVKPKRSLMFLAVTAEEKGLVGADYFARHPTIARDKIIANVNLDMPIITYALKDVIAFGADRSSIGPVTKAAAEKLGLTLSPDPSPEQAIFTRSDHYRFVQQGVPAVFLVTGKIDDGGSYDGFLANHYHKPSDQMDLPFNWTSGVKFVALNEAVTRALADAPARPLWNKGDFFGLLYGGAGAK
jgi:Zn-dependent M28 family amino/carboxypeptidase